MFSRSVHFIISIGLLLVFQLPAALQLQHVFEKHDTIHLCSASGDLKHLHKKEVSENCHILHVPIHYTFVLSQEAFITKSFICINQDINYNIVFPETKPLPFAQLRAPPFS